MPEFLGMDKRKWLWVGVAGAGAVGLYLLMHQGGAAPSADSSLPATGPANNLIPGGNLAPGQAFDPGETVAQNLSSEQLFNQKRLAQMGGSFGGQTDAAGNALTGVVSKAWEGVVINGQQVWEDIYHPGHIINEQQAESLSSQNSGPYAKGQGGFFGQVRKAISGALNLAASFSGQAPLASPPRAVPNTPPFTPGIAPSRTPTWGNPQQYAGPGQIQESA